MSESAKTIDSIAIRVPNWVGDAIMATPALRSMRKGFPSSRIGLIGKAHILKIFGGLPYFDESIPVTGSGLKQILPLAGSLRERAFDLGLILPNSFSSALAFFLGRVKQRIGYALNGRTFLLHHGVRPVMNGLKRKPSPMTEYYLDLARTAGGAETSDKMELRTLPELDEEAGRLFSRWGFDGVKNVVGLNPGASFGPSKLWTPEGFARVSDLVQTELGGRTVLLCGPGEEALADEILARAEEPIIDTSRAVVPLDLLKSVVARLDALVTTDTGPRHFAAALDVPVVVTMGPTDPRYTETNLASTRVIRRTVDCAPCHKKICDTDHRCMRGITGDEVFASLKEII